MLLSLALLAPGPVSAAGADAARAVQTYRPRPEPVPLRAPLLAPARRPARPLASAAELRRLRADLAGVVAGRVGRARTPAARAALLRALRAEELELRRDRARAFEEALAAPAGSAERKAWWTAAQAGTALLDGYAAAYAALGRGV